jgi:hypothetical protein
VRLADAALQVERRNDRCFSRLAVRHGFQSTASRYKPQSQNGRGENR